VRPHPIFVAIVAVTVLGGALAWTDVRAGVFLLAVGGWVVSLSLHEFGHAYAAYRAGDTSMVAAGYLTLNPLRYTHPFLSIILPLFFILQGGIGLPGGAVYLHPGAFRTRAQRSRAAAAGPASNVVLALVLLLVARGRLTPEHPTHLYFWAGIAFLGFLQLSAAVLNLLPIPGLDGYAIIEPYLSPETTRPMEPVKPWGMLGLFALLQIDRLNIWFFDLIEWLYNATGAPAASWAVGYNLFRFWH